VNCHQKYHSETCVETTGGATESAVDSELTGFQLWRQFWGRFLRGISPSKIGHVAPFLDRIQPLSKTRVFLYTLKMSEGCFVLVAPSLLRARTYLFNEENS
jgi:hypothetical protein